MSAERMMVEIAGALPPDVIIADDAVTTQESIHGAMEFNEAGSVYGGRGGALGWGMGGAMGVKLAHRDRPVVAVVGDGSSMMTVQALWTAANADIPVVYVICNNRSHRVLKPNMDVYQTQILKQDGPRSQYLGMDFPIPFNIAGIAEATGVYGRKIEDPAELAPRHEARPGAWQACGAGRAHRWIGLTFPARLWGGAMHLVFLFALGASLLLACSQREPSPPSATPAPSPVALAPLTPDQLVGRWVLLSTTMPDGTGRQVMLEPPSISGTAAFSETTFVIKTTNQAQGIPGAGTYEYSGTYTFDDGAVTQTVTAWGYTDLDGTPHTSEEMSGGDRHLPYTGTPLTV